MKEENFKELVESIEEFKAIEKGELKPSKGFYVNEPNAFTIRRKLRLTQEDFATLLGVSLSTVRDWELGKRKPKGAAKLLLRIAQKSPSTLFEALE